MEPSKTSHGQSFTTAFDLTDKENSIRSAFYTGIIVLIMALALWFYSLHMEIPIPFPKANEVEMLVNTEIPVGGDFGAERASAGSAGTDPDPTPHEKQFPAALQQTDEQEAVAENKSPEQPLDHSIQKMRDQRRQAERNAASALLSGTHGGSGGDNPKGNNTGYGDGEEKDDGGFKTMNTFHGRVFRGGNTPTDCHEGGKVVLEVKLLPSGRIIFEDVDPATTGSDCLIKAAREILGNSSFNTSENPASTGTITFIFKLN